MKTLRHTVLTTMLVAGFTATAHAEPMVASTKVASGYVRIANCTTEADPTLLNECICKADIEKATITGLAPAATSVINTQLAQVPEQMASESCAGEPTAAPASGVSVNAVSAKSEVVYQSPAALSVLVTYSSFAAGAAHPTTGSEGYTFNLASGKTILPTEMLTAAQLAEANTYLKQELTNKYGTMLADEAKARTEPYLTDSGCENCTLYYTKDGWNVRFQLYSIAPYAAGEPTVTLPTTIMPDPETLLTRKK